MNTIELIPPNKSITGIVEIGGSKSFTNRAIIMASLANGKSIISSLSKSEDSNTLIRAMRQLGVSITQIDKETIEIVGKGGQFLSHSCSVNVGHAGTAMRFLTALCCLVPGKIILDGSPRMRKRPIQDLVSALRQIGADITYINNDGFPPIRIQGGTIHKSSVSISGKVSSQFISALLLIAPVLKEGLEICIIDEQISKSYIDMTFDSLKSFGVKVINDNYKKYIVMPKQKFKNTQYRVEGDASGASYLFALAAISGGTVTVQNINPHSSQGDVHFVNLLEQMGCTVKKNIKQNSITVSGPKKLQAISADMSRLPDTAQTLALIAAFAKGTTHISGLSTLRIKETYRLKATKNELKKMGITSSITEDSITVQGGSPHGTTIKTYKDHRMALSFAVAGAVIHGIHIQDSDVVQKSFPNFWEKIEELGVISKKV